MPLFHSMSNQRSNTMQLTKAQAEALQALVDYTLANERTHFLEYVSEGGNPEDHIYGKAIQLSSLPFFMSESI